MTRRRGEDPELAFAEFLYRVTAQYNTSALYRRRLHAESPTSMSRGPRPTCPTNHPHGASSNCYQRHRCACEECRVQQARRELGWRKGRAHRAWQGIEVKT